MRTFSFCLLLAGLSVNIAFAQKSVMMGKVVNESGKPVVGAELKVSGHKGYYKVKTDDEGNYSTPPLSPAYYHVIIDANEKYYTTERIRVMKESEMREHHNFTLTADHAEVAVTEEADPVYIAKQDSIAAYNRHMEEYNIAVANQDEAVVKPKKVVRDAEENSAETKQESRPARRSKNPTIKIIPGEKQDK